MKFKRENHKTLIRTGHVYVGPVCDIMKTCPCNEDPLTPHFYIVKLGFARVFIFFLVLPAFQHRNAAKGRISVRLESQAYTLDV